MSRLHPFTLGPGATPALLVDDSESVGEGAVALLADPGDDLFVDPWSGGTVSRLRGVGAWVSEPNFLFSAQASVDLRSRFDSAILLGWVSESLWFKVCLERDPQGRARVVSVVTRGTSDDANGAYLDQPSSWMRIARAGSAFALHSSADGTDWDLVRVFQLGARPADRVFLGCAIQSPTGDGTRGSFEHIRLSPTALGDVRDGS